MFLYSNGETGTGVTDDIVGLCVVPSTHTEDGNARFMCLTDTKADGEMITGNERTEIAWGPKGSSVVLTDIPIYKAMNRTTTADPCTVTGTSTNSFMPSDIFTGKTPAVGKCLPDGIFFYDTANDKSPYPYLKDWSKNPAYTSGNVDTAFLNGWEATQALMKLDDASEYKAASAATAYKKNCNGLETYLPTIGELGYMMARLGKVNEILGSLDTKAQTVATSIGYWSSSEESSTLTWYLGSKNGSLNVNNGLKTFGYYVRPFVRVA